MAVVGGGVSESGGSCDHPYVAAHPGVHAHFPARRPTVAPALMSEASDRRF